MWQSQDLNPGLPASIALAPLLYLCVNQKRRANQEEEREKETDVDHVAVLALEGVKVLCPSSSQWLLGWLDHLWGCLGAVLSCEETLPISQKFAGRTTHFRMEREMTESLSRVHSW